MNSPLIEKQINQIRTKYPQAFATPGKVGEYLIVIPGVELTGYTHNICTVLFVAPPGFPCAQPDHFWVDIPNLLLNPPLEKVEHDADGTYLCNHIVPQNTNRSNLISGFPEWKDLTWFSWHLQSWNPNTCSLYTYFMVIHHRLTPAR